MGTRGACPSSEAELKRLFIDSTIVRAHQHAAGAKKKPARRRSRGGLSTKLHLALDALGHPLRLILTAGQIADIDCAHELIENLRMGALIADKGYDADAFVDAIEAGASKAVIPPRSNRINPRRFSRRLYRHRNLIERFFNRIKHYRRIATRYDKLALS